MRNRHGKQYSFEPVEANVYKYVGKLDYCRMGAVEGQQAIDYNNLGFFDPSGGPFVGVGGYLNGCEIVKIASTPDGIFITTQP
jgi:hypothetical protein